MAATLGNHFHVVLALLLAAGPECVQSMVGLQNR